MHFCPTSAQVWSNPARQQLSEYDDHLGLPGNVHLIHDTAPSDVEDPCELTLLGHTSGVRCCCYSPGGDLVASTAEDGSLRVWDSLGIVCRLVAWNLYLLDSDLGMVMVCQCTGVPVSKGFHK